jgi:hypothetical protein
MKSTSLSISNNQHFLFCRKLAQPGLQAHEFAFQLASQAAAVLKDKPVNRSLVKYQRRYSVGGGKLYIQAEDWLSHAAASLRNATGESFSSLVVKGLLLLESQPELMTGICSFCWEEYSVRTDDFFTIREYQNSKGKKVRSFVPFYPMFPGKIRKKRKRRPARRGRY